ncbi:cbb3-type cytochrome-c oxidase maturation nitrogen fixation FixS-like protein (plasmid) [Rhizobium gallicum]|uniref:Cbb3-type cytochrome-c oxidase maturation nitrogen fixation FixS-like protein n=1 Tax=Rhizobium gallicum TaxID=56730 RepID=A0A1L5NWH4_9HYPH|nr:cbb3-type cytochrome oxidase assembly protein CcoS [Rhizobium gallicum]APO72250.1 cbb3-type cytochrome-c oxidase maturation nitrogen fixation FixS-like protein [Rhizobium gallicum]
MSYLMWLVPIALGMGAAGLMAFLWSTRSGQYDDLDGAAERVLLTNAADAPLRDKKWEDMEHASSRHRLSQAQKGGKLP